MTLLAVHARYQFLETLRVPIAVIGTVFFPTASMLFFVVPFTGDLPAIATTATASMVTFAVMVSALFSYGAGIAEDRAQPWDSYLRTLPAGVFPRFGGRIVNAMTFQLLAIVPVLLVAALFTEATATAAQLLAGLGAVLLAAIPFTLLGLAIGYSLPAKAAIALANVLFLPLAFGSGMFTGPGRLPGFIEAIAPYLPSRGAVELVWAAVSDFDPKPISLLMLAVWTVGLAAIATWAYRRDEGRRFR